MWSYYGRKTKLVGLYPPPLYDKIVEPFGGTAVYSLYDTNWQKDVTIVEKYDVIVRIWHYLQKSTPKEILRLPDMSEGDNVEDHKMLSEEEKWLIGFCINRGSSSPKKTAKKFNSWNKNKVDISENIYKIKHWKIKEGSYEDLPNDKATWFVDPPYQKQGKYYKHSGKFIDFKHLSEWCRDRKGQVIVCENLDADWMDFIPLKDFYGQNKRNTEAIWYKKEE